LDLTCPCSHPGQILPLATDGGLLGFHPPVSSFLPQFPSLMKTSTSFLSCNGLAGIGGGHRSNLISSHVSFQKLVLSTSSSSSMDCKDTSLWLWLGASTIFFDKTFKRLYEASKLTILSISRFFPQCYRAGKSVIFQ